MRPKSTEEPLPTVEKAINSSNYELEINVRMVGAVGNNKYSEKFYAKLKKNGVNTSSVITVLKSRSAIYFVIVENYTRENKCLIIPGATAI